MLNEQHETCSIFKQTTRQLDIANCSSARKIKPGRIFWYCQCGKEADTCKFSSCHLCKVELLTKGLKPLSPAIKNER